MMSIALYVKGIDAMQQNCPESGSVEVSFKVCEGIINSIKLTRADEIFNSKTKIRESEKNGFFNNDLKNRILKDIDDLRFQYGTLSIRIETENGVLKSYSVIPETNLNAVLLTAQMRSQKKRQSAKENRAA